MYTGYAYDPWERNDYDSGYVTIRASAVNYDRYNDLIEELKNWTHGNKQWWAVLAELEPWLVRDCAAPVLSDVYTACESWRITPVRGPPGLLG